MKLKTDAHCPLRSKKHLKSLDFRCFPAVSGAQITGLYGEATGIAFAETLISSNVVRRLPRHVSVAGFRDGGSLRRASSAQKLSPRGRRTERQLAHSQGHENNCREAFPPIPSDKRRQFVSQSGGGSCSHGSFRTNRLPAPRDFST